ncbi:MAG: winged helix-turn-helix transcriptional regulator [Ideonella sp.]|nr:winged helix-turn-helix transcriptional regulator [Ideonella sp.]
MERARTPAARTSVDQDLVFRLLRLVNLIAKPFFSEHASRYHLSINDWRVLATLAAGGELAASDICEQTGMHPMNASRSVAHLARLGRVRRGVDPRDRRRNLLRLTAAGRQVFDKIAPSAQQREEIVHGILGRAEADALRALLDKLIAGVAAEGTLPRDKALRAPRGRKAPNPSPGR